MKLVEFGFKLLQKKLYLEDHSIFYAVEKSNISENLGLPKDLYEENKTLFQNHLNSTYAIVKNINREIEKINGPIFLFGAHIFSQYLIAYGLNCERILKILDNETLKEGQRLYGTSLMVSSPKILEKLQSPTVILRAGVYNDEIKSDILNNINKMTNFI